MKKHLTIIMLCGVMSAYAQNAPPNAASTRTWTFGEQIWSDAIQMPGCNKADFNNSYTSLQCRSYTCDGHTFYYYNWPYVNANKNTLCPSPWRVPTKEDFEILIGKTTPAALVAAWGYGGYALNNLMGDENSHTYYWSSMKGSRNINFAYYLYYRDKSIRVFVYDKRLGYQVRCVK